MEKSGILVRFGISGMSGAEAGAEVLRMHNDRGHGEGEQPGQRPLQRPGVSGP